MSIKLKFLSGVVFIIVLILFVFSMKSIFQKETEDFETFNSKFHSDSIFQMSRINFPIEGHLIEDFKKYNWNSKNWQLMKTTVGSKNLSKDYKVKTMKSDSLVIENIWIENSGFYLERRFKRINNQWFLICYNEVNL